MISFNSIPANMQRPLVHIEVDPSKAGTLSLMQSALLIGQKLAAGTAPADQPVAVASLAQAKAAFGEGSMLERMFAAFFANNIGARLFAIPVVEPSAGTAATGKITVTTPSSADGVLSLYIAGQKISVLVLDADTAAQIATKIADAINAVPTLPVTADDNTADVDLTCKWKGLTGNDIKISTNYNGQLGGEALPTGLVLTITAMASGAGAPDFAAAIAAMADDQYDYCCAPFTDSTSLGLFNTEYGFSDVGRWGYDRQSYGTVFAARRDTYSNLMTWGASQNSPVISVLSVEPDAPSTIYEIAAAYTARAARALLNDPARPLQSLELLGVLPARRGFRFNNTERNNLALTGLAIMSVSPNAVYVIEREVMLYQKNVYGQGDTAYHDCTTLHTLALILRRLKQAITSKWPRHKLANDGTRFGPGNAILTPKIVKAELVAQYRTLEYEGIVENVDAFKENTLVQRNEQDPTRLDILYAPDLVNGARIFAVLAQFRLQYSTVPLI